MGLPMIQVFMIAARQVSKPIADAVLSYGKNHPVFRNKILIPVGRGLTRFAQRLRMKRLGLGAPIGQLQVSEAAALEQASDFVQQLVLFSYSVGVFASYYFYTKATSPELVQLEEFEKFKQEHEKAVEELREKIKQLENRLGNEKKGTFLFSRSTKNETETQVNKDNKTSKYERISSLPIDTAANVILTDEEYLVMRRGSSVSIELTRLFNSSGRRLRFHTQQPPDRSWADVRLRMDTAARMILP